MNKEFIRLMQVLAEAGLWDHLPAWERAAAEAEAVEQEYPFGSDHLEGRVSFFADGEELAEGSVQDLLAEFTPALRDNGLVLEVRTISDPQRSAAERDYVLDLNGIRCVVFTGDEIERGHPVWDKATIRPLAAVNTLLERAGAERRLFTLHAGGNEGIALLLDPRVPMAMRDSGLFDEDDLPSSPERL